MYVSCHKPVQRKSYNMHNISSYAIIVRTLVALSCAKFFQGILASFSIVYDLAAHVSRTLTVVTLITASGRVLLPTLKNLGNDQRQTSLATIFSWRRKSWIQRAANLQHLRPRLEALNKPYTTVHYYSEACKNQAKLR